MSSALLAPKSPKRGDAYVPVAAATGAVPDARIDPEEWKLRQRLAAAYRAVDHFGRHAVEIGTAARLVLSHRSRGPRGRPRRARFFRRDALDGEDRSGVRNMNANVNSARKSHAGNR